MKFPVYLLSLLAAGALSSVYADSSERVFIEYAPSRDAAIRAVVKEEGGEIHYQFDRINAMAVSLSTTGLERLASIAGVMSIEPDPRRYPAAKPLPVPADSTFEQLVPYGIERVQAPMVWSEGIEGEGVTVCIIDTGLYWQHEDIDEDFVLGGMSQVDSAWDEDGYGHGTHVAGTISAADNDVGVIGVSPGKASLYAVKVFGQDGLWTNSSDLVAAAFECGDRGAKIINMSLSGRSGPRAERNAFDVLYHEDGILSVAAAGNEATWQRYFPASYDSVISVAATDFDNVVADFSNQNRWVELASPGVGVLSTVSYVNDTWLFAGDESFPGEPMEFAPFGNVTGQLADGGMCLTTDTPGDWTGMVVLCERGEVSFAEKVATVMNGGGAAAVIYNNIEGPFLGTLGEAGDWIVAISLSQADGQAALAYLGTEVEVQSSTPPGNGYQAWNGTSMSTPHVAGVAALLWSADPNLTNAEIREAMAATALDLGEPGRDYAYGFGLVQAYAALQYLQGPGAGKGPKKP